MLISNKQQEANRRNAQNSTGPKTPEGKTAVRLNALTYGLHARQLILPNEDPEEYKQLWAGLETEWQPQTPTERLHLEQMATSQWLLARIAKRERIIYEVESSIEKQLALLDRISTQRARLERSFTSALRELQQAQKERQTRRRQPVGSNQTTQAAQKPAPQPAFLMSDTTKDHPPFCPTAISDTR